MHGLCSSFMRWTLHLHLYGVCTTGLGAIYTQFERCALASHITVSNRLNGVWIPTEINTKPQIASNHTLARGTNMYRKCKTGWRKLRISNCIWNSDTHIVATAATIFLIGWLAGVVAALAVELPVCHWIIAIIYALSFTRGFSSMAKH